LRTQCTRSAHGRTVQRHEKQEALNKARTQARSQAARRDRKRRQHLMEKSFADATNNHHFKRARWRRLWRQQIQDYLIAAMQNVRILLANQNPKYSVAAALLAPAMPSESFLYPLYRSIDGLNWKFATLLRSNRSTSLTTSPLAMPFKPTNSNHLGNRPFLDPNPLMPSNICEKTTATASPRGA